MDSLFKIICDDINQNGPMRFDRFWDMVLTHPKFGYYTTKTHAIGRQGDFITAPEISQIFGEMIGLWVSHQWMRLEKPKYFNLVECGAGRGTLMADLLRGVQNIEGLHEALDLHIVEVSPTLKSIQNAALKGFQAIDVKWHKNLKAINFNGAPTIIVANEFLDALPIRVFENTNQRWLERYVDVKNGQLDFVLKEHGFDTSHFPKALLGSVYEISPAREKFISEVACIIKKNTGAGLFIDYGHEKSACGDTVQAVKDHKFTSIFDDVGRADITSHVDFEPLQCIAREENLNVPSIATQCNFLQGLGIDLRAKVLLSRANEYQSAEINAGLYRLTHLDQMGRLFKVMEFYS